MLNDEIVLVSSSSVNWPVTKSEGPLPKNALPAESGGTKLALTSTVAIESARASAGKRSAQTNRRPPR